jgi:cell division protein FtsW
MTTTPPRTTAAPEQQQRRERMTSARIVIGRVFRSESSDYVLLTGVTLFMVLFGLIMVLSSSYVYSHVDDDNFFARFWSQGVYALIGVPLMLVVSRVPTKFLARIAWPAMFATCFLQALVVFTPLGVEINNNTNWLQIGPVTFQPSEGIKIALVLWLAMFLQRKHDKLAQWRYSLLPALLVSGVAIGLILKGGDLGTAIIVGMMIFGALYFAGIPLRHLAVVLLIAASGAILVAISSQNRLDRIMAYLHPQKADPMGAGWQIQQGTFALANGGIFGVGLGNSRSKWSWLPAASTDFIFAITGEELGLIGAVLVLALFVMLAVMFVRIITRSESPFARVATGAIMVWVIAQAIVNIAVVLGLIPTLGVPLPLISAGGTALISTLVAIGIVLSFARASNTAQRGTVAR